MPQNLIAFIYSHIAINELFENVEIIEVLVKSGDIIKKNDPIVTLESDKSSVEVPSPFSGKISSLSVKIGDKVSKGSLLATIESEKIDSLKSQTTDQERQRSSQIGRT